MSRILGGRFLALAQAKKLADNRRNLSSRSTWRPRRGSACRCHPRSLLRRTSWSN